MGNHTFQPKPLEEILAPRRPRARKRVEWRGHPGEPKPLWAILGQEPPDDWRPPDAQGDGGIEFAAAKGPASEPGAPEPDEISNAGKRRAPGLYVTAHPAFGVGPLHTAIEYVPEEGDPQWVSAGPEGGRLVSGFATKQDPSSRPTDHPDTNATVGRITPPNGMTDAEYWEVIKALDAAYRDSADYDTFPEIQDSYNSNSYTRGILDASGGTHTVLFDDYVGGSSPLPPRYFAPPHLRDTGFPGSLKPQQSAPHFRRVPGRR